MSGEAVEPLRKMRSATVDQSPQKRGLAKREAVVLDKMGELAQTLTAQTDPGAERYWMEAVRLCWPTECRAGS